MKVDEKELRKMILQELEGHIAGEYNSTAIENNFKTHAFTSQMRAIQQNLHQMCKIVSKDEGLSREVLVNFKDKLVGDLYQGVSYLESTIDNRLRDSEGQSEN
jgi:L-fucose isomerase-like protein